jgi:HSP20 family molecular chaperone IbpA
LDPVVNSITIDVKSHQAENRKYNLQEISRTSFKRLFFVDKKYDLKKADAKFEDAILTITFPFCVESEKKNLTIK